MTAFLVAAAMLAPAADPLPPADPAKFFDGKTLEGWAGDTTVWSVEKGEIVGKTTTGLKKNNFLSSKCEVSDFRLSVKVKLVPNKENSGIQFRSAYNKEGIMTGPQADIGAEWWGKLYEEHLRGMLVKDGAGDHVKPEDWNEYVIEAKGPSVKMWLNGFKCVDYTDEKLAKKGVIAFQVHSGGPMEVRFKDIKLEVLTK